MSKSAFRHHSYNRESFRQDTLFEVSLYEGEILYDDYWGDPWADDDYYYGDWMYDLGFFYEHALNLSILLSFEAEVFGINDVFDEKRLYRMNFIKAGRKKFIFSIDR